MQAAPARKRPSRSSLRQRPPHAAASQPCPMSACVPPAVGCDLAAAAPTMPMLQGLLTVPRMTSNSFARLRLPEDTRSMVGFGQQPATLLVVSSDGSYCIASFDAERGGTCTRVGGSRFAEVLPAPVS